MVQDDRFEAVWSRYSTPLIRYCALSTGCFETANDIAAETFSRFLEHGDRLADECVEAWLFAVARNLCASHHRAARYARLLGHRLAAEPQRHGDDPADRTGIDPEISRAMRTLREAGRLAVYLRVVEGRPYSEVAAVIGRSEGAARVLVVRSLRKLKAVLAPRSESQPTSVERS